MSRKIDLVAVFTEHARKADDLANIACRHNEPALGEALWKFGASMRRKASQETRILDVSGVEILEAAQHRYYLASCHECIIDHYAEGEVPPKAFTTEAKRNSWVTFHVESTGHPVTYLWDEVR